MCSVRNEVPAPPDVSSSPAGQPKVPGDEQKNPHRLMAESVIMFGLCPAFVSVVELIIQRPDQTERTERRRTERLEVSTNITVVVICQPRRGQTNTEHFANC